MNKYELSLSPDYCADWSVVDAIRELFQNALDHESECTYDFAEDGKLHITSKGVHLPKSTLLLGNTTKRSERGSVGGFGEGYKLALLILTREGHEVIIKNQDKVWIPSYEWSDKYESEMLMITESSGHNYPDLSFVVSGITEELKEEIIDMCLYLQDDIGEVLEDTDGDNSRILLDRKGKLYVGGLYVTDTQLDYSYDFHPGRVALNRDRKTVEGWDLKYQVSTLWQQVGQASEVARMLAEKCPDVELCKYTGSSTIRDECFKIYEEVYENKPIAKDTYEKQAMEAEGYQDVVVTGNEEFNDVVKGSIGYRSINFYKEKKKEPIDKVVDLLLNFREYEEGIDDFKEVDYTGFIDELENMLDEEGLLKKQTSDVEFDEEIPF